MTPFSHLTAEELAERAFQYAGKGWSLDDGLEVRYVLRECAARLRGMVPEDAIDTSREKWELVSAIYDFIWDWDYARGPDHHNLAALSNAIRDKFASPFESKHDRAATTAQGADNRKE